MLGTTRGAPAPRRAGSEVVPVGAFEERTAVLRSGLVLPYAETGRPGRSTPVVVVHAHVETWRYLEPALRSLPDLVHALAPTLRGHRSVTGEVAGYPVEDLAGASAPRRCC